MSPFVRVASGVIGLLGFAAIAFNAASEGRFQLSAMTFASFFAGFIFLFAAFFGKYPWAGNGKENPVSKVACPCCGYLVFDERCLYDLCPICSWEDDPIQIADPWYSGGANGTSLVQAQRDFAEYLANKERSASNVPAVTKGYAKDPGWRPVRTDDKEYVTKLGAIDAKNKTWDSVPYEYWKRNSSS